MRPILGDFLGGLLSDDSGDGLHSSLIKSAFRIVHDAQKFPMEGNNPNASAL